MEKKKKEHIKIIILSIFTLALMISAIFSSPISSGLKNLLFKTGVKICDDELVVHFIDVGQGDSSVIVFPNGQTMMIDAGPKSSENLLIEYIRDNVKSISNNHTIDYLVLTHPDTDHSGGMCAIFNNYNIKHFYRPNIASKDEDLANYVAESNVNEYNEVINTSKHEGDMKTNIINQNYTLNIDGARIEILAPLRVYSTSNSMSPIIKVSYLGQSFLFSGDIQKDAENDMLTQYSAILDADILKVAHHGSDTSNSDQFIGQVSPKYAVISAGSPNSYGHPSYDTVVTLQKYNSTIVKTSDDIIRFSLGDQGLELLESDIVISNVFFEWKVVVIILVSILVIIEVILTIRLIRYNNRLIIDK